jgi:hypothetical protein
MPNINASTCDENDIELFSEDYLASLQSKEDCAEFNFG